MYISRNRRVSRGLLAAAICCALTGAVGKAQTFYTYTVIADVTNCFNGGAPAINNKGEVAFGANCSAEGGIVIRRGDGGTLTPIFSPGSTFFPNTDVLSMNDSGVVAFSGNGQCVSGASSAIWTGDGGPIDIVHDTCTDPGFTSVIRPSINNAGAVAFMAQSGNSYDTVLRVGNGTTVTIAGPGTVSTSGTLTGVYEPSINNNGLVAFSGNLEPVNSPGLFTGAGGALTTISLDGPSSFNGINDSGRVAFLANGIAVQTGDGGPVTTIATRTFEGGTYYSFPNNGASISAAGKVAFLALLPSGQQGVFTGPDPEADAVLKTGDVIPGFGTVTGISILREAINDSGQVAMAVTFDQRPQSFAVAIIRADPIRVSTMTTLGVSPSPSVLGQAVTLTATVAGTTGVASGQVEFFDGATSLGTTSLTNGVGTLQTTSFAVGSHSLLAVFAGNSGFLPSISPAVALIVNLPPPVQPPTGLLASSIIGNVVTLRWTTPPIGPTPTNFVLEGGVTPGEVLASIPTNSPFPIFTIAAPTGAFYVRVHALAGAERSGPSTEIRIFVNTPTPPSSPADLLGLVNGSSIGLTWRNTFLGGAPTGLVLTVTGALDTSLPLGLADRFTFTGVPGGTYTFSVSAANAAGTSGASNPVTLTFPGACSGAPLSPIGFLAYKIGSTIFVVWESAASGPAPTGYLLNVSGAFVGSFPTTSRMLSGTVGPGSYGLSVLATNACGSSPATPVQIISIP